MLDTFAHHNEAHTLGMREVVVFSLLFFSIIVLIKFAGAHK